MANYQRQVAGMPMNSLVIGFITSSLQKGLGGSETWKQKLKATPETQILYDSDSRSHM